MGTSDAVYESIGRRYAQTRQPDARIAAAIRSALGDVQSVINIGAGTGSYEPTDVVVAAVEPSAVMIAQRPPGAAPARQGTAEKLPAADQSFDAALGVLTVHHWADRRQAFDEIRRVVRKRAVFLTFVLDDSFWLYDYFPGIPALDAARLPPIDEFEALGPSTSTVLPIPHDCADGFLAAYWRRPQAYLDPVVRANISAFAFLEPAQVESGVARLRSDLASGRWQQDHAAAVAKPELDVGYRLVRVELPARRR